MDYKEDLDYQETLNQDYYEHDEYEYDYKPTEEQKQMLNEQY